MVNSDVIIYTDGSSRGNPGPGGYGIVMEDCKTKRKKLQTQKQKPQVLRVAA
jgi:ribonuclease HI